MLECFIVVNANSFLSFVLLCVLCAPLRLCVGTCCGRNSKPRKIGKLLLTPLHMHRPEFRAPAQGRHGLAGIQQPMLIECALDCMERCQLGGPELYTHL